VLGEGAPGHRPDCEAERADGGPDPDRLAALLLGEGGRDDRERRRGRERRTDALEDTGADQQRLRVGEATQQRGAREDGDSEQEDSLAPIQIAELAAREEQTGEGEDVAIDDPLERALAEAEIALDRGQGDIDDGVVHRRHEDGERDNEQRPPLLR
jgi:hypothetical protein